MPPRTLPGSEDGGGHTPDGVATLDLAGAAIAPASEYAEYRSDPEPRTRLGRWARWCTVDTGQQVELAGRTHRWLTRVIDIMVYFVIVEIVSMLYAIILWSDLDPYISFSNGITIRLDYGWLIWMIFIIIGIFYEIVWVARRGHNFGKFVLGLKVVRLEDARIPGWGRCLSRALIPTIWALWLLVPYVGLIIFLLWIAPVLWQPRRQGLHDKLTATIVMKADRARTGIQQAVTGFFLAIAGLVHLLITAPTRDSLGRKTSDGRFDNFEVATEFAGGLVLGLSCWIGAIVFSRKALRRSKESHWTRRGIAVAAVATTMATMILFIVGWRTVFAA